MSEESVSRRKYLKAAGVAVAAAAIGGTAWYLSGRKPTPTPTPTPTPMETAEILVLAEKYPWYDAMLEISTERSEEEIGIKMSMDQVAFGDLYGKASAAWAAGIAPYDLQELPAHWGVSFREHLAPIDDLIEEYGIDLNKHYAKSRLAAVTDKITGDILTLPSLGLHKTLFYNAEHFIDAGLVDSKGEPTPPKTWEEMAEFGKILSKPEEGKYALAANLADNWGAEQAWDYIYSHGGNLLDEDNNLQDVTSDLGVEAIQWWIDAIHEHKIMPPGSVNFTYLEWNNGFMQARYSFELNWTLYGPIQDPSQSLVVDKIRWIMIPGEGNYRGRTFSGCQGLFIPKYTKNRENAFKWLAWMMDNEVDISLRSDDPSISRRTTWQDTKIREKFPLLYEPLIEAAEKYIIPDVFSTTALFELYTLYENHAIEAYNLNITAKEATKRIEEEWTEALRKAGYIS